MQKSLSEVPACSDAKPVANIIVFRVDGPLFYANSERLQDIMEEIELQADEDNNAPELIVMHAGPISFVDATGIQVLQEMIQAWKKRGITFRVANANGQARRRLVRELQDLTEQHPDEFDWSIEKIVLDWIMAPRMPKPRSLNKVFSYKDFKEASVKVNTKVGGYDAKILSWSVLRDIGHERHRSKSG